MATHWEKNGLKVEKERSVQDIKASYRRLIEKQNYIVQAPMGPFPPSNHHINTHPLTTKFSSDHLINTVTPCSTVPRAARPD